MSLLEINMNGNTSTHAGIMQNVCKKSGILSQRRSVMGNENKQHF
jgi:hypothetical protein